MSYEINNSYSIKTLNICKNNALNATDTEGVISRISRMPETVSLIGAFEDLVIYHNIDETVTSGYITIKEQGNFIKEFPIIGWERLDIEFLIKGTQDSGNTNEVYKPYKRSFFIYAIDEMADKGDSKVYTLRFADISALINVSSRLEHRYTGKAEDIITEICETDMFTNHNIRNNIDGSCSTAMPLIIDSKTKFEFDFISPCWKPFDFINKIVSASVSKNGTFNDCLFFQQTDGVFHFTDYLTLFNKKPIEFKKRPVVTTKITDKYIINDYILNKLFNTQSQAMLGMFGNVSKIFDFSNMSAHTFINYYYYNDVKNKSTRYSAIPVDKLPNSNNEDGYINNMMYFYINDTVGDPNFNALKQSPVACINVSGTGIDQTSVLKAVNSASGQYAAHQTARYAVANGIPCNLNMRAKSAIFTLNPCTDLQLGQLIKINMLPIDSEKEDNTKIYEFLNGVWYIGKIKYHLTLSEIKVDVECYSSSLNLLKNSDYVV